MQIAVVTGVYNEEKTVGSLIEALLRQTRAPEEIIIVDDGSGDRTAAIVKGYAAKNRVIRYMHQQNAGPARARNRGWRSADADVCVFTDGDCVPEPDWIESLMKPFADEKVAATAGTYKTLNGEKILAKFIGLEIDYKYRNVRGEVDAHGTYNLAVRKRVLEEVGGLDESYPQPSGEDWDMTYKISRKYRIIFVPEAIVGHYHPENFRWYMKNQVRRGFDRVKLYRDHPDKKGSDTYTGRIIKFQVLAAGASLPSLVLLYPWFKYSFIIPVAILAFLLASAFIPFGYFLKKAPAVALFSVPVQFVRNYAWFIGLLKGVLKHGV